MSLVEKSEISEVTKLKKLGVPGMASAIMQLLKINRINKVYDRNADKSGLEFLQALINDLHINYEVGEKDLQRIPKEGAFITISNHPYGGIDGILLMKLIAEQRPDFKVMANFLLQRIEPLNQFIMPVNPFENHKDAKSSYAGIKQTLAHLQGGSPVGIFPAGEVSEYNIDEGKVTDRQWEKSAIKMIKKANVPVVPIYFHGHNSFLFYLLASIHPLLRTASLPSEILNKKNKTIKIRIGKPIMPKEQNEFTNIERFGRYLRMRTYTLGNPFNVSKFYKPRLRLPKKPEDLALPIDKSIIVQEIESLRATDRLFEMKDYELFFTSSDKIPNILTEIGRLREETFRQVGEGTNKSLDLDEYDLYFKHLFLWDKRAERIVGAYRLGMGRDIMKQYGKKGFYISSLFKVNDKMLPVLEKSIEMGRAFVVKDYQQKPMPLYLLWKGILHIVLKNLDYRYLIGCVSISNIFSKFSKSLMINFIEEHYYNRDLARFVKPRKRYKIDLEEEDKELADEASHHDINKLDKLIENVEPSSLKMPVLLKKYVKQNAKIVAFNVDPKFNNALDGLMVLDVLQLPTETIQPLFEELNDDELATKFYNRETT